MFRDLIIPSPKDFAELDKMPSFVHPDHKLAETIRLDPKAGRDVAIEKGWDDDELQDFSSTRFLYVNGLDPLQDKRQIREVLANIEYERTGSSDNAMLVRIIKKTNKAEAVNIYLKRDAFQMGDSDDFSFDADCSGSTNESTMSLATMLVERRDGLEIRSAYLPRFKDLFGLALKYFERNGIYIKHFSASWSPEYPLNTNHTVYQQKIKEGLIEESAAWLTPTGKVLEGYDFKSVRFRPPTQHSPVRPFFTR